MTTSILLLFASIGIVSVAFIGIILFQEAFLKKYKEAEPQQFIDVYDLPNWQPLNPIAKRSNRELKKMYKGRAGNE